MRMLLAISILPILLVPLAAPAFLTIGESGELTPKGTYKIGFEPQIRMTNGSGLNFDSFIDSSINDAWSWRVQVGAGETDFWTTASTKWIPIPDYDKQPALGLRLDATFGRESSETFHVFRFAPMISKKFDTEVGKLTPFASLPMGVFSIKGDSANISQLVLGSEGQFEEIPQWGFSAELGVNMSKAFTYISGTATFYFEDRSRSSK